MPWSTRRSHWRRGSWRRASAEAVIAATVPIVFSLTVAFSAFVPVGTMPGWLPVLATHQPVSVVINAARSLILGDTTTADQRGLLVGGSDTASLVVQSQLWNAGIGLLFGPLCTRTYRNHPR